MRRAATGLLVVLGLALAPGGGGGLHAQAARTATAFDHPAHARLFPTCTSCHLGAELPDEAMWPDPAGCAACHDGAIAPRVAWRPPETPHPSNLKFAHELVPLMTRETPRGPEALSCRDCHIAPGGRWMAVQRAEPARCLECHGPGTSHLAAPDTLCATCHVPLARAATLSASDVAGFPAPPSHRAPAFAGREGHGALVGGMRDLGASSCAVCHARDFCLTCHVAGTARQAIEALAPDPRARAIAVRLRAPDTHREPTFLARHGAAVRASPAQCSTCHTRESCFACHAPSQRVAAALPPRSPDQGAGAQPERRPPESHGESFANRHAGPAATTPATCAGCHVRTDCLECHRPAPGAASGSGYHPPGFLTRHPAAAYARETTCSDCHNVGSFCTACHASAGLAASGTLRSGYHDGSRFFAAAHGQAARQSLESCTACHAERDCLTCHSALGGRRFNPHGPGFDAARLRRKNPQMCTVCHGTLIPGG